MGTRERIVELIGSNSTITAQAIAEELKLTAPAVRRHLDALEDAGILTTRMAPRTGGRGRPAKEYLLAVGSHDSMPTKYDDLALAALEYLHQAGQNEAVEAIIRQYVSQQEDRLRPVVEAAGAHLADRAEALANALTAEGHIATVRPVPGQESDDALQLCQGHCPLHRVAGEYPLVCAVESESFSNLLGVPVVRLATLSHGSHVCTTQVGTAKQTPPSAPNADQTPTSPPTKPPNQTSKHTVSKDLTNTQARGKDD